MPAIVNQNKCVACGSCIEICPVSAITAQADKGNKAIVDPNTCIDCAACEGECKAEAIAVE